MRELGKWLRSAKQDAPNEHEARLLLGAARDELDNLVVRLPLFAGMRIGEIVHLKSTWISDGCIQIPPRQLCGCRECRIYRAGIWKPKSASGSRNLIILAEMEPALAGLGEGVTVTRRTLELRFQKLRKRAGIARWIYPHSCRGYFATRLAQNKISAPSLAYLLGWTGLMSAESYVQSSMHRAHEEQRGII